MTELEGKWCVLCIDIKSFLGELVLANQKVLPGNAKTQISPSSTDDIPFSYTLSAIELCSKALYRSVFISDVPFSPKSLPKEMKLLLNKDESFESKYIYKLISNESLLLPSKPVGPADHEPVVRGKSSRALSELNSNVELQAQKGFESKFMDTAQGLLPDHEVEEPKGFLPQATPQVSHHSLPNQQFKNELIPQENEIFNQRQGELEELMTGKVLFKTQNDLGLSKKPFELEPSPIMSLYNRQGVCTKTGDICYSTDNTGILISNKNIICVNTSNGHQRFLIGHDSKVGCFAVIQHDNLLVSADEGDPAEVIVWRIIPARALARFKVEMRLVRNMDCCKFQREGK